MRLKTLLKTMLLLCALIVGSGSVWAETKSVTISPSQALNDGGVDPITIVCAKGDGTSNPAISSGQLRLYQAASGKTTGNTITFSSEKTITSIVFTFANNMTASNGSFSEGSYDSSSSTWTGSTTSVTLTVTGTTSGTRIYITNMVVYYEDGTSSTWSVTYNANDATSGIVPTDATQYDATNNTVTVLGNTGSLAKTGYTFSGWNTQADGNGTTYQAGNTFEISSSTILYAKWTINTHQVTLPAEDTYGSYSMSATNPVAYGTEVTLTYTPATGYDNYAATWSVNGAAITGKKFTMPDEDVTVTVSVEEVTEFTWDLSTNSYDSDTEDLVTWLSNYATMTLEKGSSSTNANNYLGGDSNNRTSSRFYKNNKLTITPASGYKITKVEFTATSENYANALKLSTWTNATASVESTTVTVTPTNSAIDFSAIIGETCGFSSVMVRYEADTTPTITLSETTIDAFCVETEGTIDVTYTNIADNSSAAIYFCDAQGTTASYDWVTAEINNDKDVYYLIGANDGGERTAYMKVKVGNVYSDLITITQAEYVQATFYTLATTVVPGRHYIIASGTNGSVYAMGEQKSTNRNAVSMTANNGSLRVLATDGVYEFLIGVDANGYFTIYDSNTNSTGYLYAAGGTGSNHLKTQTTNDDNGRWTITFNENNVATIKANMSGRNWMRFNNGNSKLFSCYSTGQQDIYLFERDGDAGTQNFTVRINEACTDGSKYYGTFSAPFAFTVPSDVTVSEIGVINDELLVEDYVAGAVIPANTGVMISSTTAGSKTFTSAKGGTSIKGDGNNLRPTYWGIEADDMSAADASCLFYRLTMHNADPANNVLGTIGFYWGAAEGAAFDIAANKAYLAVPTTQGGARMGFNLFGDATGIDNLNVNENVNGYYNLQGQRVDNPKKGGLYIVNGKKQIMR